MACLSYSVLDETNLFAFHILYLHLCIHSFCTICDIAGFLDHCQGFH